MNFKFQYVLVYLKIHKIGVMGEVGIKKSNKKVTSFMDSSISLRSMYLAFVIFPIKGRLIRICMKDLINVIKNIFQKVMEKAFELS